MSNRINRYLQNPLLRGLLLAALIWSVVPLMQAGVTIATGSVNFKGNIGAFTNKQKLMETANGSSTGSGLTPDYTLEAALPVVPNPLIDPPPTYEPMGPGPVYRPGPSAAPKIQAQPRDNAGGGFSEPTALAIDGTGNVWIAGYNGGVSELSPIGALLSPNDGYAGNYLNESYGLAIDIYNNVWVTSEETTNFSINSGHGNITELNSSGSVISGSNGYSGGGTFFPVAVASDTLGNIWVADDSHSATLLNNSGGAISPGSGYASSGQLAFPTAVAVDGNNNAWFANSSSYQITQVAPNGTVTAQVTCCSQSSGLAVDHSGNVWVANYYENSVSEVSSSGSVLSSGYTTGGLYHPIGIAIDGKGNVWAANYLGNSITELQGASGPTPGSAMSPATGFGTSAGLVQPYSVAIDASGNAWVANYGSNSVTEFIGAAAPVQTPLVGPAKLP